MTDFNVGACKKMAARDNIFIVSAVINEALNDDKDVVVSVFDYQQMFDALDIKKAISGIFDLGIQNRDLCLWYNSNEKVETTVQTEAGETKPVTIKDNNMQGDNPAPIAATEIKLELVCWA